MSEITYSYAAIDAFASDMGQRAAQLMEIRQDILERTQALADYFMGKGATAFFDAQQQMLHGLEGLIHTVSQHQRAVNNTAESAAATDHNMQLGFQV
jgi:WXG100 family type VII secretion target